MRGQKQFKHSDAQRRRKLTCRANTSKVTKKMKRDTEPIVFRSFSTPGLHTIIIMLTMCKKTNSYFVVCIFKRPGILNCLNLKIIPILSFTNGARIREAFY